MTIIKGAPGGDREPAVPVALPSDPGLRRHPLHPPPRPHLRLHALVAGQALGGAAGAGRGRALQAAPAQGPPPAAPAAPTAARHDRQGATPAAASAGAGAARGPGEEGAGVLHPGEDALHKGCALMYSHYHTRCHSCWKGINRVSTNTDLFMYFDLITFVKG